MAIQTMDLSAIIKAIIAPAQDRPGVDLPPLQPGDRLSGRVLQLEADGRALIDLGRFRALAQTSFDVQPGQTLQLKVVKSGLPLHLRVDPGPAAGVHTLPRMAFGEVLEVGQLQRLLRIIEAYFSSTDVRTTPTPQADDTLRQALTQLKALFEPLVLDGSDPQVAQKLRFMLDQSGLFYEKKLAEVFAGRSEQQLAALLDGADDAVAQGADERRSAASASLRTAAARDLKGRLLMLMVLLGETDSQEALLAELPAKDLAFVRRSVERLLAHVQEQQDHIVQRSSQGDTLQVISHCWPVRDQARPVRLKIYYPRKNRLAGGRSHHRIALLLDMDHLGLLRADLAMLGRSLRIDFYTRSKSTQRLLEQHIHGVRKVLAENFDQLWIAAYVSEEKIARFDQEDKQGSGAGRINIQI